MQKTKIDWPLLDYTWNPIKGCANGCNYCYAEKINSRFHFIKEWTKPELFPKLLNDPYGEKKPSRIFVGSMCDIYSNGVDPEWRKQIFKVVKENPQHTFMFLTKKPECYSLDERYMPSNIMLGTTITNQKDAYKVYDLFYMKKRFCHDLFVSVEPLLGEIHQPYLSFVDLIIVGAMTGQKAIKPELSWIKSIENSLIRNSNAQIYYKANISKY